MWSKTLPPEVLLITKNHIPVSDLRTHVCLYLSSPVFAALYDSDPHADRFWTRACWDCGIWRLPEEDLAAVVDWRLIAVDCIQKDGFCKHPQCGEALLEYNRECMQEVEGDIDEPFQPVHITEEYGGESLIPHRAFGKIRFRPESEVNLFNRYDLELDAYLRKDESSRDVEDNRTYLEEHPLLARSFATFVPTSSIFLVDLAGFGRSQYKMETWRPITVYDVLSIIHQSLDKGLFVDDVADYANLHESCLQGQPMSLGSVFFKLRTLRGIFTMCPIIRLEHAENTEYGPALSFDQQ
ncbi:hypothetical protein L226DRAFT_536493 [Lentinus tigrinus ALCF2SS1-7]|uniref:Uncharacterized protein n=1 Tax=Lentinus tigrinus ALCF2SS1-6 TaxID=1328759 RepID=A0A5C2S5H9_9APHY|nr:hypothetical protein L227DRAFT_576583 [Lentinus tigrinus ALCF2SS1-6]RPD73375.1 hypothetical protein L226DRAFT_536493 [Lentinus tigrinus ALCF2SS1-7]